MTKVVWPSNLLQARISGDWIGVWSKKTADGAQIFRLAFSRALFSACPPFLRIALYELSWIRLWKPSVHRQFQIICTGSLLRIADCLNFKGKTIARPRDIGQ